VTVFNGNRKSNSSFDVTMDSPKYKLILHCLVLSLF